MKRKCESFHFNDGDDDDDDCTFNHISRKLNASPTDRTVFFLHRDPEVSEFYLFIYFGGGEITL